MLQIGKFVIMNLDEYTKRAQFLMSIARQCGVQEGTVIEHNKYEWALLPKDATVPADLLKEQYSEIRGRK